MPPIKPMLAKAVPEVPDDTGFSYEPKWDGFRCIIFRDGDEVVLGSRNEKPLTRYFPELIDPIKRCLPKKCVIDSELIVASGDRLDFDALQQRIHPADSRVNMLAEKTPAAVMAFDLLALGGDDYTGRPYEERRTALEEIAPAFAPPIRLTAATRDRALADEWFVKFEGAGLDGLIVKALDEPYVENKRTQFKLKHVRTADCVVAGFRIHKSGDGVGSLLMGLHDEAGELHHLGVSASFTAKKRAELVEELKPFRLADPSLHPWASWLEAEAHEAQSGKMPGAPNRWSGGPTGRDHSWFPLNCQLVAEVKYVQVTNGRFRGTTRLVRFRPDRDAASCTFDQLEEPVPIPLSAVFDA